MIGRSLAIARNGGISRHCFGGVARFRYIRHASAFSARETLSQRVEVSGVDRLPFGFARRHPGLRLKEEKENPKEEEDTDQEAPGPEGETEQPERAVDSETAGPSEGSGSTLNNGDASSGGIPENPHKGEVPEIYPQLLALPISRRPLFPGFYKAVVITDPNVIKAIKEMLDRQQPYLGAFMLKDSEVDTDIIHSKDDVHEVGVLAQVTSAFPSKDEKTGTEAMTALLYPHKRIKIDEIYSPMLNKTQDLDQPDQETSARKTPTTKLEEIVVEKIVEPHQVSKTENDPLDEETDVDDDLNPTEFLSEYNVTLVSFSNLEDEPFDRKSPVINALTSEILKVFKEISQLNNMFREQIATFSASIQSATTNIFEEPARLADFAAAVAAGEEDELQAILASLDIKQRLEKSLLVLKKELMNAELQNKISKDVETKIQKRQREYYLMEQLKGIKRELGIDDGRDKLLETYRNRVEKLNLPDNVKKVFEEEMSKMTTLETSMSEFNVIRNYLDILTTLPWGITSKEQYSINNAIKILDEDHYGMKDVKDRILEFIAVGKLLGKVDGKIICFVGPPGVGKTSIGKSIARALNRKFFRFSVGGMSDVSEIKGHRRTYIGALPGRIVQAFKKCQTQNPLILIDEVDKIGHGGVHGDPSAALLEVLDPEQNSSFLDNYLDTPIDLSKVLFVCTANTLDTIPRPLLDRMEVIELTGYVAEDKVKIAEQYLIPSAKKASGLNKANVSMTEEAIRSLMKSYCRESGVRNLKKHIQKIYRKAALNVVKQLSFEDTELPNVDPKSKADETDGSNVRESSTTVPESQGRVDLEPTKVPEESSDEAAQDNEFDVPDDIQLTIGAQNLKDFVGPPVYISDRLYETTPPGVVMGLAWTSAGGCSLYVESVLEQPLRHCDHPHLEITGQLGDVMKESSRLAYSFAKMHLAKNFPENRFFEKAAIHLHCPEGAVPKDGPSAGVTMATSFLSLALDTPLDPTVAMTGELTLTGKVLRIGGLREKAVAAKRSGAKTIIFPRDNINDWEELPENVKEGLEPIPADWYSDIFDRLFPSCTQETGNKTWEAEFKAIDEKKSQKETGS